MKRILSSILIIVSVLSFSFSASAFSSPYEFDKVETEPKIEGKYAILIDPATDTIIYDKESQTKTAIASMTKMMTMLVCYELCENPETEMITVSPEINNLSIYSSTCGLRAGDELSCKDLFYGLLLPSGNDAAVALAMHFGGSISGFSELMNKKAEELGMINTNFLNPHGLDEYGHYSTAYDIALLAREIIKHDYIVNITSTVSYRMSAKRNGQDTSWLVNAIDYMINSASSLYFDGVKGLKTGSTGDAGYCFTSYYNKDGRELLSVVIASTSINQRFIDTKRLLEFGLENYKNLDLFETVSSIPLSAPINDATLNKSDGKADLALIANQSKKLTLCKAAYTDITENKNLEFVFPEATAPISSGDELGEMKVLYEGVEIGSFKVSSLENIKKKNVFERISDFYYSFKPGVRIGVLIILFVMLCFIIVIFSYFFYLARKRKRRMMRRVRMHRMRR